MHAYARSLGFELSGVNGDVASAPPTPAPTDDPMSRETANANAQALKSLGAMLTGVSGVKGIRG